MGDNEENNKGGQILLKLVPNDGEPLHVKVKKDTKLSRVFKKYQSHTKKGDSYWKYLVDGDHIPSHLTRVSELLSHFEMDEDDVEEGVQIDCMAYQIGG